MAWSASFSVRLKFCLAADPRCPVFATLEARLLEGCAIILFSHFGLCVLARFSLSLSCTQFAAFAVACLFSTPCGCFVCAGCCLNRPCSFQVFMVADDSYNQLIEFKRSQSIVIRSNTLACLQNTVEWTFACLFVCLPVVFVCLFVRVRLYVCMFVCFWFVCFLFLFVCLFVCLLLACLFVCSFAFFVFLSTVVNQELAKRSARNNACNISLKSVSLVAATFQHCNCFRFLSSFVRSIVFFLSGCWVKHECGAENSAGEPDSGRVWQRQDGAQQQLVPLRQIRRNLL